MNKEQALKEMGSNRVSHPVLAYWYTKCSNGLYYSCKGVELTHEQMLEILEDIPDSNTEWYIVPNNSNRACG